MNSQAPKTYILTQKSSLYVVCVRGYYKNLKTTPLLAANLNLVIVRPSTTLGSVNLQKRYHKDPSHEFIIVVAFGKRRERTKNIAHFIKYGSSSITSPVTFVF